MAKPGTARQRAKKQTTAAPGLIAALDFISIAQREKGFSYQTHCSIGRGVITAFDGLLTVGYPIEETIDACPHSGMLRLALNQCVESLSMTISDDMRIHVTSGKYKAKVPCVKPEEMTENKPDPNVHKVDESLREAIKAVSFLAKESATDLICASVLVTGSTAIGTNRNIVIEYYHGMGTPDCGMVIPKAACIALDKAGGTLVGFGYGGNTCTFWFESGAWLKTQLIPNNWPDCQPILNAKYEPWPLPDSFFDAIRNVLPYSGADNQIIFGEGVISASSSNGEAIYEIEGLPSARRINGKYILDMEKYMTSCDFKSHSDRAVFRGENCRGVIAGIKV